MTKYQNDKISLCAVQRMLMKQFSSHARKYLSVIKHLILQHSEETYCFSELYSNTYVVLYLILQGNIVIISF